MTEIIHSCLLFALLLLITLARQLASWAERALA